MSVFDIFKPKCKHSDPQVRNRAVKELDDQELLLKIAMSDTDPSVRGTAVKKLTSITDLESIRSKESNATVKEVISNKLNKAYSQKIIFDSKSISIPDTIAKIDDPSVLPTIVLAINDSCVAEQVISHIRSADSLAKIVRSSTNKKIAKTALEGITDKPTLEKLAASAPSKQIKLGAKKILDSMRATSSDIAGTTAEEKLKQICAEAKLESDSLDWQKARSRFETLAEAWGELDPTNKHGHLKEEFKSSCEHFNEREEMHFIARDAIAAKEKVSSCVEALLCELEQDVVSKVSSLKAQWNEVENVPPEKSELLDKEFFTLCEQVIKAKENYDFSAKDEASKLLKLEELCKEAEELSKLDSVEQGMAQFEQIKELWESSVNNIEVPAELTARFSAATAGFASKKADIEALAREAEEKELAQLNALCSELEQLSIAENIKDSTARVKELQAEFKLLKLSSNASVKDLANKFRDGADQFFGKLKTQYEAEDLDRWAHYTKLQDLAEKAEHLLDAEPNHHDVIKQIKELRKQWKETGSAPREKADEVWNRFNGACETAFEKCRAFFDELDQQRDENLVKKLELCEKVEALKDSSEWKQTADQIKEIQAQWKQIGHVPKDKDKETFDRFRAACDFFFDRRKADFDERDKVQAARGDEKKELCQKAASIVEMEWSDGVKFAKELRNTWKKIGSARRSDEETLWEEFNGYINAFYAKFDSERPENLNKKTAICEQIEELLKDLEGDINFRDLNNKVNTLKKEWEQIGPVPKENDNEIWDRFNAPLKPFYEKRSDFFAKSDAERGENMKKKEALIAELDKIVSAHVNWKETTDAVKGLQQQWKEIGHAPKEFDNELWNTFHNKCDSFFAQRKEFYNEMDSKRQVNLKRKTQICVEIEKIVGVESSEEEVEQTDAMSLAEELKFSIETNFSIDETTKTRASSFERIKELQSEWKSIGPVPKEDDKALFSRYRSACDKFFEKRSPQSEKGD